ncbi:Methyl farnesoate epoxidase [Orchesella cincta]|uniref:Methyl farnesoate epoxidase n=1 Tax=Orchesella cincta TaxID=48709 RepID=A0A1D2N2V1_ORCCI|nr:Methyl farnesoate epoxidase [Orchesella cincta]
MISALVLIIVTAFLIYYILKPKLPPNFPPGPANFPIVGGSLFLSKIGKNTHDAFHKLGDLYGPLTGLYLGNLPAIVINGYEQAKELFARDDFNHRPSIFSVSYPWGGRALGVFFSNGRLWQENRRFALRHLRDFGFGKTSMEGLIHEEAEECIETMNKELKKTKDSVITIHDKFGVSVINILWAIMGGTRYRHDDEEFKKMLNVIQESFRSGSPSGNLVNAYPFLRHFPYFKQNFQALVSGAEAIIEMLEKSIEEHKKNRDPSAPRDLIDVYLQAIEDSKDDPDTVFFKDQLVQLCEDLFAAGAESTSNSIAFCILHMVRNPDCQEKVQKELDAVVGKNRFPSFEDKANLPYTFAVISEAFRISPVAPISVPHMNIEDTKLLGYNVPKGTSVMVNFPSINLDKKYWGDPEVFRPERFLDESGNFIKAKLDHVHGFGAGKRQCLGEPLARMSNYLLVAAVLQRFKFEIVPGQPKPTTDPIDGFTIAPQPFSAKVTPRY